MQGFLCTTMSTFDGYLFVPIRLEDGTKPKFPLIRGETMRSYLGRLSRSLPNRIVKAAIFNSKKMSDEDLDMTIDEFASKYREESFPIHVITKKIDPDDFAMLGGRRRLHFRHSRSKSRRSRAKKSRAKRSRLRRSRSKNHRM